MLMLIDANANAKANPNTNTNANTYLVTNKFHVSFHKRVISSSSLFTSWFGGKGNE